MTSISTPELYLTRIYPFLTAQGPGSLGAAAPMVIDNVRGGPVIWSASAAVTAAVSAATIAAVIPPP